MQDMRAVVVRCAEYWWGCALMPTPILFWPPEDWFPHCSHLDWRLEFGSLITWFNQRLHSILHTRETPQFDCLSEVSPQIRTPPKQRHGLASKAEGRPAGAKAEAE